MPLTLAELNAASTAVAAQMLDGLYEHSPWIAEAALEQRPFASVAHLKHVMVQVLTAAGRELQRALIRAHPELAGKAMVSQSLTAESTNEQQQAGLAHCSPEEFRQIQQLNADYNARFGFPFILAVRGPRGTGLPRLKIIETFERRLHNPADFEFQACLHNIHRIAELRLNDKFSIEPALGNDVWDWLENLSVHSDPGFAEKGQLTVTYLTDTHRTCAQHTSHWMRDYGFDEVAIDAVGNVVGRFHASQLGEPAAATGRPEQGTTPSGGSAVREATSVGARSLMTGSHYDTVRNGGKYDGRLGIFVPMACVRELSRAKRRLPFAVEVVAFAEEEGQRYQATFLGSGALIGDFKSEWLDQKDADGITLREAMQHADLCFPVSPSSSATLPTTWVSSKSTSSKDRCSTR